jgi:Laminin EGF domain
MKKILLPLILILSLAFVACDDDDTNNNTGLCADVDCSTLSNSTCNPDNGICECDDGYTGDATTGCIVDATSLCDNVTCAATNASCNDTTGYCECDEYYTGDATTTGCLTTLCDAVDCSDATDTTCNIENGECECDAGFTGNATDGCVADLCYNVNCSGTPNSTCNSDNGICECDDGYTGDATDGCTALVNIITNGDFETWTTDASPDNWMGTNGTIDIANVTKSASPYAGAFAVNLVNGTGAAKDFNTEAMILLAGTYNCSYWVLGNGDIRGGWYTNGMSSHVAYTTIADDVNWTQLNHDITLTVDASDVEYSFSIKSTTGNDLYVDDVECYIQ